MGPKKAARKPKASRKRQQHHPAAKPVSGYDERTLRLLARLDDVRTQGKALENVKALPTRARMQGAIDIVKAFIVANKRKVYGGMAICMALSAKMPNAPGLYVSADFPDYDIYSPTPHEDMSKIIAQLDAAGYKDISVKSAFHASTLKLFVENATSELLDITYVWGYMYRWIPSLVSKAGMHYVAPKHQCIDTYSAILDFMSWHKLDKNVGRISLLERLYLVAPPPAPRGLKPDASPMRDAVLSALPPSAIVIGALAYNVFMRASGLRDAERRLAPSGEVQTATLAGREQDIADHVRMQLTASQGIEPARMRVAQFLPQLEQFKTHVQLQVDGLPVLTVYGFTFCVPYQKLRTSADTRMGTFHMVLRMLFVQQFGERVEHQEESALLRYMIANMYHARENYFRAKRLIGTEDAAAPFKELTTFDCLGDGFVPALTKGRLAKGKFFYNHTSGTPVRIEAKPFANTSGRLFAYKLPDGSIERVSKDDAPASTDAAGDGT
jgi:hypothetical protein